MIVAMTSPIPSFAVKPTLVGERVLLRPVAADDAVGLVEMLNDPEVQRLTGTRRQVRSGTELERAEQWYSSRAADDNRLDLAIVEQYTNSPASCGPGSAEHVEHEVIAAHELGELLGKVLQLRHIELAQPRRAGVRVNRAGRPRHLVVQEPLPDRPWPDPEPISVR